MIKVCRHQTPNPLSENCPSVKAQQSASLGSRVWCLTGSHVRDDGQALRCGAGAGGSENLDDSTIVSQRRRVYACAATTSLSAHAGKDSTFHKQERQTQPHPHSVGHGRNGRARGGRVTRTVDHLLGAGVCTDLGAWDIARHAPSQRVFVAQIAGREQVALSVAGSLGAAGRCWQATVCVRRWRGDRPLRNSPSVTSALQAVVMPTMSSCASAMIGES